jgi:membrane protein
MKKINLKNIWVILQQATKGFSDDRVLKMSGSLAYSTIFSIAPLIILIISLADIFYGRSAIEGTIYGEIRDFVGSDAAVQIQNMIRSASLSGKSHIAISVGVITLVLGATSVFGEIQDSINIIWGLKPKPKKGWVKMLLNRLWSFSVIGSFGFILLVSLVVNTVIEALMARLHRLFPGATIILVYIVNQLVILGVTTLLFGVIFKVLPDARIKWRDVMAGAFATALLFMGGKFVITFYINHSSVSSAYGAAGSLVVILLWVYYSSAILFFGAEFTKAYAAKHGSRIYPNQYAVWVKVVEVEETGTSLQQIEEKKEEENRNSEENVNVK